MRAARIASKGLAVSVLMPRRGAEASSRGYASRVEDETYTIDEAARILRLTPGRIHQMLRAGELEGL
jgi:hypothetical protein